MLLFSWNPAGVSRCVAFSAILTKSPWWLAADARKSNFAQRSMDGFIARLRSKFTTTLLLFLVDMPLFLSLWDNWLSNSENIISTGQRVAFVFPFVWLTLKGQVIFWWPRVTFNRARCYWRTSLLLKDRALRAHQCVYNALKMPQITDVPSKQNYEFLREPWHPIGSRFRLLDPVNLTLSIKPSQSHNANLTLWSLFWGTYYLLVFYGVPLLCLP